MTSPGETVTSDDKIKIAIIGSGISGSSCAYFLKHTFGEKVDIVVFEQSNQVGGRLATYEFNEREYEIGGSVLHPSNKYMEEFVKKLDLEKKDIEQSSKECLGLYDSNGLVLKTSGRLFGLLDSITFANYFGFFQLLKFKSWVRSFVKDFSKIYRLQDNGFVFKNLEEFLVKLNPNLYELSQKSLEATLKEHKFNDKIIYNLASIACLTNYGQSVEIDGLVGSVSLAGTIDKLWSVKSGNKSVPAKLIEKSGVDLKMNTKVKLVGKDPLQDEKNIIVYEREDKTEILDNGFDYVIIGFPIYKNILGNNFRLDFETKQDFSNLEMQITNTYFIYGELILFNDLPVNKRIQLHSVDPSIPFRCVCVQLPCDYSKKTDKNLYVKSTEKLYKIFAEQSLDEKTFDKIFKGGYRIVKSIPWLAYPKYETKPSSKIIPNIILDSERSRIFYANSLEWSSSCMEICVISARNVTNLIALKEKARIKKFFTTSDNSKSNLHLICKISSIILIGAFLFSSYYKI